MKFAAKDKHYLDRRRTYSEKTGPQEMWSIVDHWPLYAGTANIGRFLAISDLLRSTLTVPGHVAEFGSWRGANLLFMTKLLNVFDPHGSKVVHCFDSFEGLTTFAAEDGAEADASRGSYAGSFDELLEMIALYELQDDIVLHKGLIQDTLPPVLSENEGLTFSFIYCDTDLFEPTKIILKSLHNRLAKGGLFVFDQWNDSRWPGEGVAANEFMVEYGEFYETRHVAHARPPTMVLKRIRV